MLWVVFLTTPSSASRTLQSRFFNLEFSLLQTCGKDSNFPPSFILLTVWKITTLDESNEFPLTLHHLVGIGNSQPASFVFLSVVFAGFRTIPAMDVVKIKQFNFVRLLIVINNQNKLFTNLSLCCLKIEIYDISYRFNLLKKESKK